MKVIHWYFVVMFAIWLAPMEGLSQSVEGPIPTLESPYNTMYVHLYYLQPDTYQPEIAAQTFNLSDSTKAEKLAIQLKQILDGKGFYVRLNLLPQDRDYRDSLSGKAYYTPFPNDLPQLYLEKLNDNWYYSAETAASIPQLHKKVYPLGAGILMNIMPRTGQRTFLGLALWQYVGLFILILSLFLFHLILNRLIRPIVRRLSRIGFAGIEGDPQLLRRIERLLSILMMAWLLKLLLPAIQLPIGASRLSVVAIQIFMTVIIILLILNFIDIVMRYARRFTESTGSKLDDQLLPILRQMVRVIIIIGGIIQVLRLVDVNVTALVAGISIGGLALALAAQDTVKNLFGSAMIFLDQPFQIDDYIEGAGFAGTVVEVGFRTTRLQTLDTSIISVPNGTIANMAITNKGVRVYRVFNTELTITYDTPPDLIEKFVGGLKRLIEVHPITRKEGYYVHLSGMAESSLNIMFRTYFEFNAFDKEMIAKEEFLLAILRLAEALGIEFAFPSSSVYVENFPGKINTRPTYPNDPIDIDKTIDAFVEAFVDKVTPAAEN